jgi:hypothetical protein
MTECIQVCFHTFNLSLTYVFLVIVKGNPRTCNFNVAIFVVCYRKSTKLWTHFKTFSPGEDIFSSRILSERHIMFVICIKFNNIKMNNSYVSSREINLIYHQI